MPESEHTPVKKCPHCGGKEFMARSDSFDYFDAVDGELVFNRTESGDGLFDEFLCSNCGETLDIPPSKIALA